MKNELEKKIQADARAAHLNNLKKKAIRFALTAALVSMTMCNAAIVAFADNSENANTDIDKTTTMGSMVGVVFWVVRVIILIIAGVSGLPKVVQGQADENPRDRNNGLATIGIAAAAFAATFALEGFI